MISINDKTRNKIAIVTTGHPPFDERIYWKFALSMFQMGYEVQIICTTETIDRNVNGISIKGFLDNNMSKKEKLSRLFKILTTISPNIIICCEPFAILPAFIYKNRHNKGCKVISDITEWYPENVSLKINSIKKIAVYFFLYILNIFLTNLADALIIGEITKKRRYDLIAPFKKKIIIGYYPVLKYWDYNPPELDGKKLTLCYAGLVSFQRGILTLVEIANILSQKHKEIKIKVKIVGNFQSLAEENRFDSIVKQYNMITFEKTGRTEYSNISNLIKEADICFDLRENNFIYNNSLPIKIFEYMAAGKPFIFTDIIPIRKELGELNCGFLVEPSDKDEIIRIIEKYISNPKLLKQHSENGRVIIENSKNWESESEKLISFIAQLSNPEQAA